MTSRDLARSRSVHDGCDQDTFLEKLIGLDGVKEFPVYLCGAGVPAKKLASR